MALKFPSPAGITDGGTGATTIAGARANLGVQAAAVATVDLAGQTAAIPATTIYTAPTAGTYRISWVAKVTTPASVSSVLGGTSLGFQVVYIDADDSVVATTQAALSGSVNAGNTTASTIGGVLIVSVAASTAIQYQIGYTSVGAPAMAYNLHVKVEKL